MNALDKDPKFRRLVANEVVKASLAEARDALDKGDLETASGCVSYAERWAAVRDRYARRAGR